MKTIIVWFRNDLRVSDVPALATAATDADVVIPIFILNTDILKGRHGSSNRNRFLFESLKDLTKNLKSLGSNLIIRQGDSAEVLKSLSQEFSADAVYYSADYSPYSIKRDKTVKSLLDVTGVTFRGFPGRLIVSNFDNLHTKSETIYKVFTPFYKNWQQIQRRQLAVLPKQLPSLPDKIDLGELPDLDSFTDAKLLSPDVVAGGESEAQKRLEEWLKDGVADYRENNNDLALNGTSRMSSYLHFGCLSPLEIESMLPDNDGARAWHRQLCWREFYNYILFNFPNNAKQEFQERYRNLDWSEDEDFLKAWQDGQTGYPIIDASMRQLLTEGWMHNRARLIVGSFLTKDLWIDWRLGEKHFMNWLLDGDEANNNGNWQWITSVGVDPAPIFRRLYNPGSQQKNHDPNGVYIRRHVLELADVPNEYLAEPWTMPKDVQVASHCIIGQDYPEPIVDHAEARRATLERFRQAAATVPG